MVPQDIERYLVLWGPGILILIVLSYGFMRLAYHWIDRAAEIKRSQMDGAFHIARDYVDQLAGAAQSQAEALSRLAGAVEHRGSLESYEHREMLISLKALDRNVNELLGPERATAKAGD
ncbi:MAG TPA: hypothetical protein VG206_11045 [Terriglobia bacterium]|nr:hypothetical protein [Terriglobia bacterium]